MEKKIKKILIDQGLTITELARKTGYKRGHLSAVIHGRIMSDRARKVIALALGVEFDQLWSKPIDGTISLAETDSDDN
jgi:transcriptional regulator with XRE-family HTH domain